jgi:hypothetical protein
MKYFIPIVLLFFAVSTRAQITLEHAYNIGYGIDSSLGLYLLEVDSGSWKYVGYSIQEGTDTSEYISVFNLDHSLDRLIRVPSFLPSRYQYSTVYTQFSTIAKNLFAVDGKYEYLYSFNYTDDLFNTYVGLRVFNEDGSTVFSCDSCQLYANSFTKLFSIPASILSTDSGVKMLVENSDIQQVEVYALPGKLPNRQSKTSGVTPSMVYNGFSFPTSAYPNPSNGQVRIAYTLPPGVLTGDVILTTEDGREVKRYHVMSAFSDLLIEASDLPSGSYFYKIVTEKGESPMQKIALVK